MVVASLLVFPNAIPWLVAAWLLAYTVLLLAGRRGLICLGACAAVLAAKRVTPSPCLLALVGLMLVLLALGVWIARRGRPALWRRFAWLSAIALWFGWGVMAVDWYAAAHCRHPVAMRGNRPVVCLGDSMTSQGSMLGGYPNDLRKLVSLPVVDMGINGIAAAQVARSHLPELVSHNPQVVVIELGVHDFIHGDSRAATKAALKKIIDAARRLGAEVVLMEFPRAPLSDPYWGLEREIARQEDVELVPDTALRTIFLHSPILPPGSWLGRPYLTDDWGIHPNAAGNRLLAESVAAALDRLYGPAIRRRPITAIGE
jgi:lysophospholipase L1-like esterase